MKKTMHTWLLWLFAAAAAIVLSSGTVRAEGAVRITVPVEYGQTEARDMLEQINNFRKGAEAWYWSEGDKDKTVCTNLNPLTYDYQLEEVAMLRAAEIAIYYSHTRPNGNTCFTAYPGTYTARAENIAAGYVSADKVFEGWQETNDHYSGQGHRRNMLSSNYTAVGIGHVYYNGYHYWVQEFGNSTSATPPSSANDSLTRVSLEILESNLTSITCTPSKSDYHFDWMSEEELPSLSIALVTPEIWPENTAGPIEADYSWSVENTAFARISDGKLVGIAPGSTNLTTTVLGQTVTIPITVTPISLDSASVTLSETDLDYDDTDKTPGVTVVLGSRTLTSDDYDVSYENNHKPGTATVTVTGKNRYSGSVSRTFTITCRHRAEDIVTTPAVPATCTQEGRTEGSHCSVCGTVLRVQVKVDKTPHILDDGTITKDATCTETGILTYRCKNCNYETTKEIKRIPHTEVVDKAIEPTCTREGRTEGSHCSVCGTVIKASEMREKLPHSMDEGTVIQEASCTQTGICSYQCKNCGYTESETLPLRPHTLVDSVTKARVGANGKIITCCDICGEIFDTEILYAPKTLTLSAASYTCNGKVRKPSVKLKDSHGTVIPASSYRVTYSSGCKNVGKYTVTVKFTGNYTGTMKKTFTILPRSTSLSKITTGSWALTVKWKKQATQTSGYEIQYATNSKFKKAKTVKISKNKTVSKKIKKLKARKKYYVRIRTFKKSRYQGKSITLYSSWSKAKSARTKK